MTIPADCHPQTLKLPTNPPAGGPWALFERDGVTYCLLAYVTSVFSRNCVVSSHASVILERWDERYGEWVRSTSRTVFILGEEAIPAVQLTCSEYFYELLGTPGRIIQSSQVL